MPCHPARARQMLKQGKAAVYKFHPFTIILKHRVDGATQPVEFKVDPGSKVSGMALVVQGKRGNKAVWLANLKHRGHSISSALTARRALRRTRRGRKIRYRPARFLNRKRCAGWLPPSLTSRVNNLSNWFAKLTKLAPITECQVETVRFDTQAMVNPEIQGVEYQQGELAGFEVREYLLEKWQRTCVYCDKQNVPLEIDHIHPRSRGGSNRVTNLTLSCRPCNVNKGNQAIEKFLAKKPEVLKRIQNKGRASLKDTAAVNATRYALGRALQAYGLPTYFWSGGRTKFNRIAQGYAKEHCLDAVCVGKSGAKVYVPATMQPLLISAMGRGTRQTVRTDRYGFPRNRAGRIRRVQGFQTGDWARLKQPTGKYAGIHVGRIAGIRADGRFDINASGKKITANWKKFEMLQRSDGYAYSQ